MKILIGITLFLFIIAQMTATFFNWSLFSSKMEPIKVGLIFSSTGHRADREKHYELATLFAIDEINRSGGLLRRQILPIIRNGDSNWKTTKAAAEDLIINENVSVIFGAWTTESRYTTKKLFEKHRNLLVSPYQYDGLTSSQSIINVGTAANQQLLPAIYYSLKNYGSRFFIVGSDNIFSHLMNLMIQDYVTASKGTIEGISYFPSESLDEIIEKIVKAKPSVILSSISGSENHSFFKKLREAGITAQTSPVFSFTLTETLLNNLDKEDFIGHYAVWNYFQSIPSDVNEQFISRFKKFSGVEVVDNTIEAAYLGVYLWGLAVNETETTETQTVEDNLIDMQINAPEGSVTMDMEGKHAWKYARIAKVNPEGKFEIVWQSPQLIPPVSIQLFRSTREWEMISDQLYQKLHDTSFSEINDDE